MSKVNLNPKCGVEGCTEPAVGFWNAANLFCCEQHDRERGEVTRMNNLSLLTTKPADREKLKALVGVLYPPGQVTRKSIGGQLYGLAAAAQSIGVDLPELLAALRVEWDTQKQEKENES